MDMITCVARRTRSRTESYMNSILNRSKGIHVEDQPEGSLNSRTEKKRGRNMREACSSSPAKSKRRRRKASEDDDDVEFVGTILPEGKRDDEHVVNDNVSSSPVILESESVDCGDRVSDFAVDDTNFRGEEENSTLNPLDDDVVLLGTVPRENVHVEDENVGSAAVVSPGICDFLLDDANLRGDEKISEFDDVVSLSSDSDTNVEVSGEDRGSGDSDSDEDVDSDSSDYMGESSDSSDVESYDSDFVPSEDEEGGARDVAKGRKSPNDKVYTHKKSRTFREERNLDVPAFHEQLAKSIWEGTKFKEDFCSGEEIPDVDYREDVTIRESSTEKVNEQGNRKPREPRSFHRVKEKNHLKGESFDGDLQEKTYCTTKDSPPLNLRFGCEEPKPIERTEEEKVIDSLWEDMALALSSEGVNSSTRAKNEDRSCSKGKHDFVLDEEIGLKCLYCSHVAVEIRDVSPAMDKYRANVNDNRKCGDKKGDPLLDRLDFEASDHSGNVPSLDDTEGTVWQYIPGIKDTLFPHQQEGFEFIWKNIAGTTKVDELSSLGVKESGGCIISHAPGTGKTRLTIIFLQSYLERFPNSRPVVIAPASVLLTWEAEFRKWNANIPFHNMNSSEFSGYENDEAVSHFKRNGLRKRNKHSMRLVKLYLWRNNKSILGVSYSLYERLAKNKYAGEKQEFRRMFLELPGLLVLDEGHTPRNHNSCIWKVLTEVRTEKRLILSGTVFQNNFKELSNVLCLARPAYTERISSWLQELSKRSQENEKGSFNEETGIVELKNMIAPFVHVHKGNREETLPGRRDCVVLLNPSFQQKKILARIDNSQNTLGLQNKLSAVSVHPSLYLCFNSTKKEELVIGPSMVETLKRLKLDPKEGVKTRFLIDFIRFSETLKEKVLVFSQSLDTLELIRDQLCAVFGWIEKEQILYINGQIDQKDRQQRMDNFNNPDSKSKVLLASTKACSEGISLIGASRVVLLDVVWNPSVEKQAISRAYRFGQKRVVYTYHLMVTDASEWEKYCKQTKKDRISEQVFTNEKEKLINKEVVSEDKILDEMVRHEKLKDMFVKILPNPKESDMFTNNISD
ncbi:SNF2 domain-containing protein CLASSY 4 [Cardamine amara subsp. amara]|uniref:SNF2 domain-containing protein CLASSY 4 n=1 Tax=Cardamine amara subsp. amara TaxID=228776 RepID=A0ABD0Z770_CARAN